MILFSDSFENTFESIDALIGYAGRVENKRNCAGNMCGGLFVGRELKALRRNKSCLFFSTCYCFRANFTFFISL